MNLNKANLISAFRTEREPSAPPGWYKAIILDALAVLTALVLGLCYWSFVVYLPIPYINIRPSMSVVLVLLSIFFLASLFEVVLLRDGWRRFLIVVLEILGMSIWFYDQSWRWLLTFLCALVLILWGSSRARREMDNNLTIHFYRVSILYFGKLVFAISLLATIFYFPYWQKNGVVIPRSSVDGVFSIANTFTSNLGANIDLNLSIRQVAEKLALSELKKNPQFENLGSDQQKQLTEQTVDQLTKSLSTNFGLPINDPSRKITDILYDFFAKTIQSWEERFDQTFFVGWTIALLLLALGFGRLYIYGVAMIGFILFQTMIGTRFIKISIQPFNKENLEL